MEKQNFGFAGQALSEVWSKLVIDKFPTIAEYIDPDSRCELDPDTILSKKSEEWIASHVRTSQYFTQIIKCGERGCCQPERSSYFSLIQDRFLPPPVPIRQSTDGLRALELTENEPQKFPSSLFLLIGAKISNLLPRWAKSFTILPYDAFCPSVHSCISDRICKHCHIYFASQVMLKKHISIHRAAARALNVSNKRVRPTRIAAKRQREMMAVIAMQENSSYAEWLDEDELDTTGLSIPKDSSHHLQDDESEDPIKVVPLEEHFTNPWEDEEKYKYFIYS